MSGRHWSHDWHGFDDDEDRSEFMCHYCEICTCHSPEKSAGACDRLAEVKRAAAEKAYARGRLDERHDCDRRGEYERGELTLTQLQADLRPLYPYRRNEGGDNDQS